MNILHINTSDTGGAFNAAYRLYTGLCKQEVKTNFLVLHKNHSIDGVEAFLDVQSFSDKITNSIRYRWLERKKKKWLENKPPVQFSFAQSSYKIHKHPLVKQADIIHLHWVANFLDYQSFFKKINKPVVWTLHDMNPFCGGSHYNSYKLPVYKTLDEQVIWQKQEAYKLFQNLHVVALSKWMLHLSEQSELLKKYPHYLIANGLNTEVFIPYPKEEARQTLGLPQDKKIILFVAESLKDHRKGFANLLDILGKVKSPDVFLAILGGGDVDQISIPNKKIGFISNAKVIAQVYSAADIFVIPSQEDNLPNTVLESMACGTPVVGFDIGGIPDMIESGYNGFVTKSFDHELFANNIDIILKDDESRKKMSKCARETILNNFSLSLQTTKCIDLYNSIL